LRVGDLSDGEVVFLRTVVEGCGFPGLIIGPWETRASFPARGRRQYSRVCETGALVPRSPCFLSHVTTGDAPFKYPGSICGNIGAIAHRVCRRNAAGTFCVTRAVRGPLRTALERGDENTQLSANTSWPSVVWKILPLPYAEPSTWVVVAGAVVVGVGVRGGEHRHVLCPVPRQCAVEFVVGNASILEQSLQNRMLRLARRDWNGSALRDGRPVR